VAKFTDEERRSQRQLIGMLMKGDPKRKAHFDARIPIMLESMKKSIPDATDEILAEFASSMAFVAGTALQAPLQEVGTMLRDVFDNYNVMAAFLLGVYDPKDSVVPSADADLAAMLGVDEATLRRITEHVRQHTGTADKPSDTVMGTGQYI
jgi:hypothetical protein